MNFLERKNKIIKRSFYVSNIIIGLFLICFKQIICNDLSFCLKDSEAGIEIINNIGLFLISYTILDLLNINLEKVEEFLKEKSNKKLELSIFKCLAVLNSVIFIILLVEKEILYYSMFIIPFFMYIFKIGICEYYTKHIIYTSNKKYLFIPKLDKKYLFLTIKDRLMLSSCVVYTVLIYIMFGLVFKLKSQDYITFQLIFFNKYLDYLKSSLPSAIHCDLKIIDEFEKFIKNKKDIKKELKDLREAVEYDEINKILEIVNKISKKYKEEIQEEMKRNEEEMKKYKFKKEKNKISENKKKKDVPLIDGYEITITGLVMQQRKLEILKKLNSKNN